MSGVAVFSALLCITTSTIFDSPSEIINPDASSPTPVVRMLTMEEAIDTAADAEKHKARKKGIKAAIAEWVQSLPAALRVGVILPLYALGTLITKALGAVFTGVMAPVLAAVLKWLILALVIFLAIGLVLKAIFPDIPLSKLLRPKYFLYVLIGVAVIALLDKALPLVFSGYRAWADALKFTLGLLIVIIVVVPVVTHRMKIVRDRKMALEA